MLSIAIPSSSLINEKDEKIKTYKVGIIARAAAVFRVDEIIIYYDPILDESDFIAGILEYLETPQYLRKHIFPIKKSLQYAGLLPPLGIPSHRSKHLKVGETREGVVRHVAPDGTRWVDIGTDALAPLKCGREKGARVTVRICSKKPLRVEEAEPQEYWGYRIRKLELKELVRRKNLVVTSRKCGVPKPPEIKRNVTLVFGNPEEGVFEIAERLGIKMEAKCWNVVPQQGTRTVRLEEAIFAALSLVNFADYWGGLE
ncbi:putative RNA uridine N3 methyltransferase [Archaeoglobus neptunius]|uniref:putative RNA uridine N3 methyltransferase n=1 Tax=Archaeoglobus neptunius TaxID=2798580 RepID=UPI0019259E99|nr:putative RNA uridine N3 methyltransferase [Archaeoglobus neptunius]